MDLKIKGKVALVLASSQGLGKAIALELAKEGAKVMISSRDESKLQVVQQELKSSGFMEVEYQVCDITKQEDIEELVQKTKATYGTVDILINNAGGPPGGGFEDLSDEDWYRSFELNLLSYVRTIRSVLPEMKKHGGKIINIASTSIKQPIQGLLLSNTFRLGIVGLTKTLADELAPHQILINTVAPGRIATDRIDYLDQLTANRKGMTKEEVQKASVQSIPLGRYGTPEEFAQFVTFLCSDINTYVTGSSILIDGGMVRSL
ncbi:SDR family oxidoreductase [Cytobacillus kochii]